MKISKSLTFICGKNEYSGVKKISRKVANDVKLVFNFDSSFEEGSEATNKANAVIFGTLGKSEIIEEYANKKKIDISKIIGKREVYGFFILDNQLLIIGSEKRGTIYGLFYLSELLSVSPLVEWCDILPEKKESFELSAEKSFISKEPSVRYRGFFINDEWPAFGNWCNKRFGGFNVRCYEHVFELLLRMKGNYLWPAMWSSIFSNDGPGLANAELADELGVVMGASHHEPCCRAGEEYKYLRGPGSIYGDAWNFLSNEKGITKFWEDGLKRSGKFENVITVGMRGEADTAIMKDATLKDNIDLLHNVLRTQNNLIRKYVNEDLSKVPRMIALYKEVEPYYYGDEKTRGLMNDPELEGVIIMLCDDNHGNLRTVPTKQMLNHKGGYGLYYHFDYHGAPYSYEWFNTTYLPKVKEQMSAAYDFGIRDLWIVNVGDIFTNEFPMCYFFDLAYDYNNYSKIENTTQDYTSNWINLQFPYLKEEQKKTVFSILDGYTRLTHRRRTECLQPNTYHPINYCESDETLNLAEKIISDCEKIKEKISIENWPGFFTQIYLPACGNMNILRMQLYSGKNQWLASKSLIAANWYAEKVRECYEYDKEIVDKCDTVADGKWYAMGWSEHFGFKTWCEAENHYPVYMSVLPTFKKRIAVWIDGNEFTTSGQDWTTKTLTLDSFKNPECNNAIIKVGECSDQKSGWTLEIDNTNEERFISCKIEDGKQYECPEIKNIIVTVDRKKLDEVKDKKNIIRIKGDDGHGAAFQIDITVDASVPEKNFPTGTFVQTSSYISIDAEHFINKESGKDGSSFEILPGYGKTSSAVKNFPVINTYSNGENAPSIEYSFAVPKEGKYRFYFYMNPTNPAYKDNKLQFISVINDKKTLNDVVSSSSFAVGDGQEPWGTDVTNNIRILSINEDCKQGLNTLKIYPVTPGLVLEKIVIHRNGERLLSSYLGPKETFRVK